MWIFTRYWWILALLSLVAVTQVVHWASKVPEAISSQRSLNAVDRPTIYTFYDVYEEPTEDDIDLLAVWKKKWILMLCTAS